MCLKDYETMYEVFGSAGDALRGRVLVNLNSGTPEEARAAAHTVVGWPWLCSVSARARPMGPRRERIDEAVAGLLAGRARLEAIIAATAPAVADDPEACAAAVAAR